MLMQRIAIGPEGQFRFLLLQVVQPDVIGSFRLGRELAVIKAALHLRNRCAQPGQFPVSTGFTEIVDQTVIGLAADKGLLDWAELQLFLIFFIEPLVDPVGFGFGCLNSTRGLGS